MASCTIRADAACGPQHHQPLTHLSHLCEVLLEDATPGLLQRKKRSKGRKFEFP